MVKEKQKGCRIWAQLGCGGPKEREETKMDPVLQAYGKDRATSEKWRRGL